MDKRMVAVFVGDGWKVVSFMEVKAGERIIILDEDQTKIVAKDAYQDINCYEPYHPWTIQIVTSTNKEVE